MLKGRIGYQLKRASHALRMQMDNYLRKAELTTPKYAALAAIQEAPGLSGNKLARKCFVTSQTMNLVLVSLENAGLIVRHPHPNYKRSMQIYLTPIGQKVLQENNPGILEIEEAMVADLTDEERHQFFQMLYACADSLEV